MESANLLTFEGHRYFLASEPLRWNEAKAQAETVGGHLATINSQAERDWVGENLGRRVQSGGRFYLGGFQPNPDLPWQWVTDEPFDLSLWPRTGPDDKTSAMKVITWWSSGWDDVGLNHQSLPYLVEWDGPPATGAAPPDSPVPPVAGTALPAGVPIDVLAAISLARDQVDGEWTLLTSGSLVTSKPPGTQRNRLYLPLAGPVPDEYDLTVRVALVADPTTPNDSLCVGILCGGQQATVNLYGNNNQLDVGLGHIDGQSSTVNGTRKKACDWPLDKPVDVVIQVRRVKTGGVAVRVTVDGVESLRWIGQPAQLSNPFWSVPDAAKLFLGSNQACRIDKLTLTPVATSP